MWHKRGKKAHGTRTRTRAVVKDNRVGNFCNDEDPGTSFKEQKEYLKNCRRRSILTQE